MSEEYTRYNEAEADYYARLCEEGEIKEKILEDYKQRVREIILGKVNRGKDSDIILKEIMEELGL